MTDSYVYATLAREVKERARNRCAPCQTPADYAPEPLDMEPTEPHANGGTTTREFGSGVWRLQRV